jgi:transcriptional regulator with XRE-family HTH domain
MTSTAEPPAFGRLLREWRSLRRRSQLGLSLDAEISARHLSFLETGRARPSREMVLLLASALEVPLRERNALLQAAGFAPAYRETGLTEPAMAEMVSALRLILGQHEPFPARALDRHWDLVMINDAYREILARIFGKPCDIATYEVLPTPRINVRPYVANWEEVARDVLARVRREAAFDGDAETGALLAELARSSGLPASSTLSSLAPQAMVIPVVVRAGTDLLRFFTTLTTLGAPQDITLAELRIEAFHAADAATEATMRAIARDRDD